MNENAYVKVLHGMLMRLVSDPNQTIEKRLSRKILIPLVEAFEQRYAIAAPNPLSALRELVAANDFKQKDILSSIGSRGVIPSLNGRCAICKAMAHKLATRFNA